MKRCKISFRWLLLVFPWWAFASVYLPR